MGDDVKVIGPTMFNPFESVNPVMGKENKFAGKSLADLESLTIDCFDKKIDSIVESGLQQNIPKQQIDLIMNPLRKLVEAYVASANAKTHTISVLIETILTVILLSPNKLDDFTKEVVSSFHKTAVEEIMEKVEKIREVMENCD